MSVELAKRAIAAKGWKWMPGMRLVDGGFAIRLLGDDEPGDGFDRREHPRALPDLDDPATLGCVEFGLLTELGGRVIDFVGSGVPRHLARDGEFNLVLFDARLGCPPKSRAHALVLALESYDGEEP